MPENRSEKRSSQRVSIDVNFAINDPYKHEHFTALETPRR